MSTQPPVVLTIAGSDSGAGAGIQADLKTIGALGGYAVTAVTAITAQNTRGVSDVLPVPAATLTSQLSAIFDDFDVAAIKIGMMPERATVDVVAGALAPRSGIPVVLDPVISSSSGRKLQSETVLSGIIEQLLPLATIVTPNVSETARLIGLGDGGVSHSLETEDDFVQAGKAIQGFGPPWVLLKGGHRDDEVLAVDLLVGPADEGRTIFRRFAGRRISTSNSHGTGCTLSSAIAAGIANGMSVPSAVGEAKRYTLGALLGGTSWALGQGNGPLNHLQRLVRPTQTRG